jgi:hypothetical protein
MSAAVYAIGRGEPPLHTPFTKGQSGNPGGEARAGEIAQAVLSARALRGAGKAAGGPRARKGG